VADRHRLEATLLERIKAASRRGAERDIAGEITAGKDVGAAFKGAPISAAKPP
jgi:hypothetical protein